MTSKMETKISTPERWDKIKVAYIEEPPFYWTDENKLVKGADIELVEAVLQAMGVLSIEYHLTTFEELLPGVKEGRWDMNVPIFATAEREKEVAFSLPVWSLGDGFIVLRGNPKTLTSYEAVIMNENARLGVIPGQVQYNAAKLAGVNDNQIIMFNSQPDAIAALLDGKIDAFAATAIGNRATADANPELEAVPHQMNKDGGAPIGAFSFHKSNQDLLQAVNSQLRKYIGSTDHRLRVAKYGITQTEIDSVVTDK